MFRLLVFALVAAYCSAWPLGYNFNADRILNSQPQQVEVSKSFYFFAAPEETIEPVVTNSVTSNVKKNLQVVVIKAPEYKAYTNAALNLARQAAQQKTLIYVLNRQPDIAELQQRFQNIQQVNSQKPEVVFIKYKTAEEAAQAHRAIKSQYDNRLYGNSPTTQKPAVDYIKSWTTTGQDGDDNDDDDLFTARKPPFLPTGVDVVPGSSYLPPKRD